MVTDDRVITASVDKTVVVWSLTVISDHIEVSL